MHFSRTLSAALFSGLLASTAAAQRETDTEDTRPDFGIEPSFTVGFDFSQGDFGQLLDTTTLAVPFSARADVGDFRFSATTSWLQIEGPGGVVGDGVIVGDGPIGGVETNNGIGDVLLGVNYNVPTENTGKFIIQFQGRLKVPTASTSDGLGTGEVDGGGAIDVAYDLGNFTPFVTAGYRFRGDPDGINLNNTFNASVGGSYNLGQGYAVLASYDFREATTDTSEESQEVFGAVTGRFNQHIRWTLYGSAGFTDGAPDGGAGIQLTIRP